MFVLELYYNGGG